MEEEKKLTPMRFRPDRVERKWGSVEYRLADLGYIDSTAADGWLADNTISDIMQTYLERLAGEIPFEYYGTQFPVMVKWLDVRGRTSLHVNPDDETAEQRYDAFGKTALWYVADAGPEARLFLGFRRDVTPEEFYGKCLDGTVEDLLHSVTPQVGACYLVPPGMVHAAQDVKLLEIAESSELWFRLHAWGDPEAELDLEEGFDLIDFKAFRMPAAGRTGEGADRKIAVTPQFTVTEVPLTDPLRVHTGGPVSFQLYACVRGAGSVQADGAGEIRFRGGDAVLVPAERTDFTLVSTDRDTLLLEVRLEARHEPDKYINPDAEPYLKGEEYNGLEGDELPDPELGFSIE